MKKFLMGCLLCILMMFGAVQSANAWVQLETYTVYGPNAFSQYNYIAQRVISQPRG